MLKPRRSPTAASPRRTFNYRQPSAKHQRPGRKKFWVAAAIVGLAAIWIINPFGLGRTITRVSDAVGEVTSTVVQEVKPKDNKEEMEAMRQSVQTIIDQNPQLTIGVHVIDLRYNTSASAGTQQPMLGASTTKLLTAAVYLSEVEKGNFTLDQKFGGYAASWHLEQMINQSNNASWETLIAAVSYEKLGEYAADNGMPGYDYYDNSLTAADEAALIQKLYSGKLLNKEHTNLVLSHMQNTNNELLIPPAAGPGVVVYHKYGQYLGHYHDAGVLVKDDHPIVVAIYTKSADGSYAGRVELIQQITRAITGGVFVPES